MDVKENDRCLFLIYMYCVLSGDTAGVVTAATAVGSCQKIGQAFSGPRLADRSQSASLVIQ